VITVFIDEPIIDHYGGKVAAPAFKRIADQSLRYLGVSPRFSKARSRRKSARESEGGEPDPGGDGEGTSGREEPDEADLYRIEPGPGEVATPDLTGATMKAAFDAISAAGLRPVFSGTGFAADQVPAAGDPVEEGGFVRVEFLPYLETADRVEGDGEDR